MRTFELSPTKKLRVAPWLRRLGGGTLLTFLVIAGVAGEPQGPEITFYPTEIVIRDASEEPRVLLMAKGSDVTAKAQWEITGDVAKLSGTARVRGLKPGTTELLAKWEGETIRIPVRVERLDASVDFGEQVVPVLTRLGCNGGNCHGKLQGRNGFRLSLLGFDPDFDFETIVKESRGRRVFPSIPGQSLLLAKATARMSHGGGKRLDESSEDYRLLERWVTEGMPRSTGRPHALGLLVYPEKRILAPETSQPLLVFLKRSDGSTVDVTRLTQFASNDPEVAGVDEEGLIKSRRVGRAAIMARYAGMTAVTSIIVPNATMPEIDFQPNNFIDEKLLASWKELRIAPSSICSDEEFLRRARLDLTGTLPDLEERQAFLDDTRSDKRSRLIDRLVETPEYASLFAGKWADVLRVRRRGENYRAPGTFTFHEWIRESIAADKPYDQFVRELLVATGDEANVPPVIWYKEVDTPEKFVDDVGQLFLGVRLTCADCHHHPYEKWSRDDYWGMAAFFGKVGLKNLPPGGLPQYVGRPMSLYLKETNSVLDKKTSLPLLPKPLDAPVLNAGPSDPRTQLADWLVDPKNPDFAAAVADRYWAHFFGRGLVDPFDDRRATNPSINPELSKALAKSLVDAKYSLKSLVKSICKSRAYELSSEPNSSNRDDRRSFARRIPRRLPAEVVFDALCRTTGTTADFPALPRDRHAPQRAIDLPDESFPSHFLDVFGRPKRATACECERGNEASLSMILHLLNGKEIQDRLARADGRAAKAAADPRPDAVIIDELFLVALGRKPTAAQRDAALEHLKSRPKDRKGAYENILWALINGKEFLFNR